MKKIMFLLAFAAAALISFQSCGNSQNEGDDDDTTAYNHETDGVQGHWLSDGENVAPLLIAYNIVKITATFNANGSYAVVSYDPDNVETNYAGTYSQTKSEVAGIWNITLNQTIPSAVTSEGIFRITKDGDDYSMEYEVVQTDPTLGYSAPTASGGFGSTDGGSFGISNIQVFIRTGDL